MQPPYKIPHILPATDAALMNDVYLVLLYVTRVPPHLLVAVNGKIFTLSVKGPTVDGELTTLLTLIRRKNIETLFIRLALPPLFTLEQLKEEIRSCTLAYPRADIGVATCLTPIKDFCHSVYNTEIRNIHLIFDLLPTLQDKNVLKDCYSMNLPLASTAFSKEENNNSFELKLYEMNDVYEAIRQSSLIMV